MKILAITASYIQKSVRECCPVVRLARKIGSSWEYDYTFVYAVKRPKILKLSR